MISRISQLGKTISEELEQVRLQNTRSPQNIERLVSRSPQQPSLQSHGSPQLDNSQVLFDLATESDSECEFPTTQRSSHISMDQSLPDATSSPDPPVDSSMSQTDLTSGPAKAEAAIEYQSSSGSPAHSIANSTQQIARPASTNEFSPDLRAKLRKLAKYEAKYPGEYLQIQINYILKIKS